MPGILCLREDGDTITVVSEEVARDGDLYMQDIEKFCDGYPGLAQKMASSHEAMRERITTIRTGTGCRSSFRGNYTEMRNNRLYS